MISEEQRNTLASKLLERNLVSTHDEARALAEKFLEMDVREAESGQEADTQEAHTNDIAVAGSGLESAQNAEAAYEQVLYYERIALEPSGRSVFANARVEADVPQAQSQPSNNEALERLHKTEVDLSQMFNVDNMRKAQES